MTTDRSAGPLSVGVDIGGTKVLGVAVGTGGEIVADAHVLTPAALRGVGQSDQAPATVLTDAVAQVADALGGGSGRRLDGVPVGVGLPGMVDGGGVLRFSPHLPGAAGVDAPGALGGRFPGVLVDNDANCAAVAEHVHGAGRGCDHFFLVTLGTGIGGGLVVGGEVQRGAHGFAGEIGHMVVDPSGPPCPCGGRGCWERLASGGGLGRLAREAAAAGNLRRVVTLAGGDPEAVRGEHVARAADAGDAEALAVVGELGRWVALGLANLVAVLDPERIVLGGGLAEMGELLLDPIRRSFGAAVEGAMARPPVEIVAARFGERAGAVGAAVLARRAAGDGVPPARRGPPGAGAG